MFEFINRNKEQSLIVFSGWGFDHRIMRQMGMPFNCYLYTGTFDDAHIAMTDLIKYNHLENIAILGWSMGAYLAADIACEVDCEEVILVSARPSYPDSDLLNMKQTLKANKDVCLKSFYRNCFGVNERAAYKLFVGELQPTYVNDFLQDDLINSLDVLGNCKLDISRLSNIKSLCFAHGTNDKIAPFDEIQLVITQLPNARLVTFDGAGHLPFLSNGFAERIHG